MKNDSRLVWMNGQFVPETEARISIYDSALMFGDMVFEMMRSFNKKTFRLNEHLDRLYSSMRYLKIPEPMPLAEMAKIHDQVLEKNAHLFDSDDEYRSLINVSRGPLSLYRRVFDNKLEPTVVIGVFPLKWVIGNSYSMYKDGVPIYIPSQRAIPAQLLEPKVKNRSRLYYQMANLEMQQIDPNAWALLLDPDGFLTEGTGSNFFLVKDKVLYTPEPRNILRGISRQFVMELAKENGISVVEKNLELYDLYEADEAFFTCTPFSILPGTKINGLPIGNGKPGPLTTKLIDLWSKKVGVNLIEQARLFTEKTKAETNGKSPRKASPKPVAR